MCRALGKFSEQEPAPEETVLQDRRTAGLEGHSEQEPVPEEAVLQDRRTAGLERHSEQEQAKENAIAHPHMIIALFVLSVTGCDSPGASKVTSFYTPYITRGVSSLSTRTWQTSGTTAPVSDLGTDYGDVNGAGNNNTALWGAGARVMFPPSVAAPSEDKYLMAFSQFDALVGTPETAQSIFLGSPLSYSPSLITWPTSIGGFQFMSANSAVTYPWSFSPQLVIDSTGAQTLSFLSASADAETVDYDVRAWVKPVGSSVWVGDGGGTAYATLLNAAGARANRLGVGGLCAPRFASDHAGGLIGVWCAPDTGDGFGNCAANGQLASYSPFFGWTLASTVLTTVSTTYGASLGYDPDTGGGCDTATIAGFAAALAPPVGAGVDAASVPDGLGYGWIAQVVYVNASNDYSIVGSYYDAATRAVSLTYPAATPTTLVPATGGDILFSPRIFVKDSTASFTLHYIQSAASAASGDLMRREFNADVSALSFTPTGAAAVVETGITFTHYNLGEYFPLSHATSPDGSRAILAWVNDTEAHVITYDSDTDSWDASITELPSPNGGAVKHIDAAINNDGDAMLVMAHAATAVPTDAAFSGFYLDGDGGGWSSATSDIAGTMLSCQLSGARVSVAIDSVGNTIAGVTCLPAGGIARNVVIHFR